MWHHSFLRSSVTNGCSYLHHRPVMSPFLASFVTTLGIGSLFTHTILTEIRDLRRDLVPNRTDPKDKKKGLPDLPDRPDRPDRPNRKWWIDWSPVRWRHPHLYDLAEIRSVKNTPKSSEFPKKPVEYQL